MGESITMGEFTFPGDYLSSLSYRTPNPSSPNKMGIRTPDFHLMYYTTDTPCVPIIIKRFLLIGD